MGEKEAVPLEKLSISKKNFPMKVKKQR